MVVVVVVFVFVFVFVDEDGCGVKTAAISCRDNAPSSSKPLSIADTGPKVVAFWRRAVAEKKGEVDIAAAAAVSEDVKGREVSKPLELEWLLLVKI